MWIPNALSFQQAREAFPFLVLIQLLGQTNLSTYIFYFAQQQDTEFRFEKHFRFMLSGEKSIMLSKKFGLLSVQPSQFFELFLVVNNT